MALNSAVAAAIRGHGGMRGGGHRALRLQDREVRNAIIFMFNPVTASASSPAAARAPHPVKTVGSKIYFIFQFPLPPDRSNGQRTAACQAVVATTMSTCSDNATPRPPSRCKSRGTHRRARLTSESKSSVTINNMPSYAPCEVEAEDSIRCYGRRATSRRSTADRGEVRSPLVLSADSSIGSALAVAPWSIRPTMPYKL